MTETKDYDPVFDKIFPDGSTEKERLICKVNLYLSFGGYGMESEDLPRALAGESGDGTEEQETWLDRMFDRIRELDESEEVDFRGMDIDCLKT